MPSSQLSMSQNPLASRTPAMETRLTAEEWGLILEALSAYKHHTAYRELYEKLAPRQIYS